MREFQFDGIVGPTHNYAGLSPGNVASTAHGGQPSNPRAAARQGLAKMGMVMRLGVPQAVLPPHDRPSLSTLRALGFTGADEDVLARAAAGDAMALRLCSSASAMWTANAATVTPSCDAHDGRLHLTPANLQQMFHRAIEASTTTRVLRAVFKSQEHFVVHAPLPGGGQWADEGAANHLRLTTSRGAAHVFAWGRSSWAPLSGPLQHPARQTLEASRAVARLHQLPVDRCLFPQQSPVGIDGGAFHTDVLAVGSGPFLMLHEHAFVDDTAWMDRLRDLLGDELFVLRASDDELPLSNAVAAYPFNSQVLVIGDGSMVILAPEDARDDPPARAFLDRAVAPSGPVSAIHYTDVRQSMHNGGGPACLRLRVPLTDDEARCLACRVVLDADLETDLAAWIDRHYRDRLVADDLRDPALAREGMYALDDLTRLLELGSVYDFQRA